MLGRRSYRKPCRELLEGSIALLAVFASLVSKSEIMIAATAGGDSHEGAVNSGRLPATRTYTGDYRIDPAELHRVFSPGASDGRATALSMKRDATDLEGAEETLQAQIDRLFRVGELIRNELDNDRDAWRSQADRLRQLVG
jgi:hypothetical protein